MDSRKLKYCVKFLTSADSVSQYKKATDRFFSNLPSRNFHLQVESEKVRLSLDEFNYDELHQIPICITCSNIKNDRDISLFVRDFHNKWCEEAEKDEYLAWIVPEDIIISSPEFYPVNEIRPREIAFGTLPGMKDFVQTYRFQELKVNSVTKSSLLCKFFHLQKEVVIFISNTHKSNCDLSGEMGYKISFTYDSIIRIIGNCGSDSKAAEIYFQLEYPPFIYEVAPDQLDLDSDEEQGARLKVVKAKELDYSRKRFQRTFQMGCSCNKTLWKSQIIGRNLVLKLVTDDKFQFRENLEQLRRLRCFKGMKVCFTHIKTHILKADHKVKLKFFPHYYISNKMSLSEIEKFDCDYAWSAIHSRSDVILHHMSLMNMLSVDYKNKILNSILRFIKMNLSAFIKALYSIADMVDKGILFNFLPALQTNFSYYCNFVELNELPRGMTYVRRVILTPSRTIYLKPYEHFDNRIIRQFGVEYMMRVSVQDDNFSKITYAVQYNSCREKIMRDVVGNVLLNGISIGSRRYEPLAASTSQLREHGMWLYAKDMNNNTAATIREWMGDFSAIKNVAKYMARMGQCLSSTETGVQICVNDEDEIPDFDDIPTPNGKYIYSDGIGIVSFSLAEEVRKVIIENSYASSDITIEEIKMFKPVAFQIRYKGCKGMVVEYPIPGRKIGIRPSMKKFECTTSKFLEIVKTSSPTKLFLNKHLITILEQMGIPKEVFMNLEISMIMHHFDSLMDEEEAAQLLTENLSPVFPFSTLQKSGITLTNNPFFRSLLLAYFKSFAEKLKVSMRIAVPDQFGRNMLGVLDETRTLKYGQVFVQYSKSLTDPTAGFKILKGPVLVTKNPSLHPGDVRKLTAVDVPALHHITDCIVFPAQGKRPHPDEMAGSDLDGDEMVVIWYKPLIFRRRNEKPMDYPVYKEKSENQNIQLTDMINFFCEYIQNDNIGTFAHAHLVWADRLKDGIFSKKCMDIAKRYPYVLDFAKHGTREELKKTERPHHYPDFLQKGVRGNTYHSHRVLGSLYRTSRVVDACSSKINLMCETASHDSDLEYPGWENYEASAEAHRKEYTAKVLEVLDRYCLVSEAEAFSGFIELEAYKKWREEKSNAIKIVKKYMNSIMGQFKNIFFSEVREECGIEKLSKEEKLERKFQRASAWYMVVYGKKSTRVLSFPWILSDILSEIKKKRRKISSIDTKMSSFFEDIDRDISQWCDASKITCSEETCLCNYLLKIITQTWFAKSGLNFGNSTESAYCNDCYSRIISYYSSKSNLICCQSCIGSDEFCTLDKSCSPALLLVNFLKFFISNVDESLRHCDTAGCEGFLPKNLQELALQTFSYIAVTRNIFYLGVDFNSENFTNKAIAPDVSGSLFEEEGDPFKIPADPELKKMINSYLHDIKVYLKKSSGVKQITLTPDATLRSLVVNSIGKNWQRWNLQEILLDTNLKENLKQNLNMELEMTDSSSS